MENQRIHMPLPDVKRILVKMPNWLGDAVMSLPAIDYLRRLFPNAWIACLIKENLADLLRANDALDAVMTYEHGSGLSALSRKAQTIRRVRWKFFDLAVLFTNSFESALWMYLARISFRVGYRADARSLLLTHAIRRKPAVAHQISHYLDLCRALGEAEHATTPRVQIPPRDRDWAEDFLASVGLLPEDLLIGLCPGAAYGSAKRWSPARFIDVSRQIGDNYPAKFAVFGGKGDTQPCEAVAEGIGQAAMNLCGKTTLRELAALLDRCTLVISNDSGAMHLAAAVGTHTIAIFGPTDPARSTPPENCTVIRKDVFCSPCSRRECPTDHRCMTSISPEEVYQEVAQTLFTQTAKRLWRNRTDWMP